MSAEQLARTHLDSLKYRPEDFISSCKWIATWKGLSLDTFRRVHQALGCSIEVREIVMNDPEHETPYYRDLKERGGGYFTLVCSTHHVASRSFEQ